jgi:hypothetical protein
MKKIFALVMIVSILGAFMAGCNKDAAASGDAAKPADTAGAGGATK